MFENVKKLCHIFKKGSPLPFGWRHIWGIALKTTHPKITGIFQALDVYNQNQCEMFFLFLLHSINFVSQLQTCFRIAADFINGIFFLPCI
jgi:hypothetical protein